MGLQNMKIQHMNTPVRMQGARLVQSLRTRRAITLHFSSLRRTECIICFKYRSLINKSLARVGSVEDSELFSYH